MKPIQFCIFFSAKLIREFLNKTAELEFTGQINQILKTNFEMFVKAFKVDKSLQSKNNLKILAKASGFSEKDFIYHTSKSGKTTTDYITDIYSNYLANNGNISNDLKKTLTDESLKCFYSGLKVFQEHIIERLIFEKPDKVLDDKPYDMSFYTPKELYSMFGENKSLGEVFYTVDGFPHKVANNKPYVFSVPMALNKKEWTFLKEPLKETISLVNDEFIEIIDNFTSEGKVELIEDAIINNRKPVIASARIISSAINLYDTIYASTKRENKNEKISILAVENPITKKAVDLIEKDFLKEHNIELLVVNSKRVAVEVAKANSKKTQYAICSNYVQIARGISLANSDDIIVTDALDKMNDAIQFLARGFNPQADILSSDIYLHNGGYDMDIGLSFKEDMNGIKDFLSNVENLMTFTQDGRILFTNENEDLEEYARELISKKALIKPKITQTDALKHEIYESNRVYKGFTSGTLADTMETNINEFFKPTKQYENILNNSVAQDNNQQIKFL